MSHFDDNEDYIIYGRHDDGGEPRIPQCRSCGSTDVRWRQQGGRWMLMDSRPGIVHVCPISTDEFGVVPE